jgi:chitin disaccharide deacetylase
MSYLIFNADDYGLSPAVSAGIVEAARGVVRSTTVMANLASAAELAQLAASAMGVGVHLNLSYGPPLSQGYPGSLLNAAGGFDKRLALDPATWETGAHRAAAQVEWQAQLERLLDHGLRLDHADSHHHTHLLAPLFPLAVDLAQRRKLGLRTGDTGQRSITHSAGIPTPDDLMVEFFGNNCIGRASLLAALGRAHDAVVEVMCHPGRVDDLLQQRSGYCAERELELTTLGDPGLAAELERSGWQLADYGVCNRR